MNLTNLNRLAASIMCEPWLIAPQYHAALWSSVMAIDAIVPEVAEQENKPVKVRTIDGNIAVMDIMGPLGMRLDEWDKFFGMTDFIDIQNAIDDLATAKPAALILHIDSPGGSVNGTPETAEMIKAFDERVAPVVSFTDGGMNSAAYWLGSRASGIVATRSASVGSIGVYMAMLDVTGYYNSLGVKTELFKSGQYKGMGVPGIPLSESQRELLQKQVDEIFTDFKTAVLAERDRVSDETMQGQSVSASEALKAGLIDLVGGFDQAVDLANELIEKRKG